MTRRLGEGRGVAPGAGWVALAILGASLLLPVSGWGPTICAFKNISGLDCPGCGLTRSITSVSHLDLAGAWAYNPFGLVLYPILLLAAASVLVPRSLRDTVRRAWRSIVSPVVATALTWILAVSMLVFGVIRAATQWGAA